MGNMNHFDTYEKVVAAKEIQAIFSKFEFLNIKEETYKKLITKIMAYAKDKEKKGSYISYVAALLNSKMVKHITFLLNDEEKTNIMFENFISLNFKKTNCYEDAVNNITLMGNIFDILNQETLINLLNNNQIFNDNVRIICEQKKKTIETVGVEKLFHDIFTQTVVSIYCMINNIKLGSLEENMDTSDLNDDLKIFLKEIAAIPRITNGENLQLIRKAKTGDVEARNRVIEANMRLVITIARKYNCDYLNLMDLIQEGSLGLIKAIDLYNPDYGFAFSTYAYNWIRQTITRAISDKERQIRIPVHMLETMNKYTSVEKNMFSKLHRKPTVSEMAKEMHLREEKILKIRSLFIDNVSLNEQVSNEITDTEIIDLIPDENVELEEDATKLKIEDLIKMMQLCLNEREIDILLLRSGYDGEVWTLQKIAEKYGLTRERVRQIEAKALRKLRVKCSQQLADYRINPIKVIKLI